MSALKGLEGSEIASDQVYQDEGICGLDNLQLEKRYKEERAKRLRGDGNNQYFDVLLSKQFRHFQENPWVDATAVKDIQTIFPANRCQMLIFGARWGGLLYVFRMAGTGTHPEDIRISTPRLASVAEGG
ncbi:hypothetical protein MMC26_005153 [Xylographa opegraphella]|nr:hypothetical protein [Xylographa opegraphella]